MNYPTISIIIPIYNVSDYLDACIESVCNQSYSNLEIILVDDGSSDNCPQKCDNWAIKDSRIKVVHKSNGGLSDARNAGLDVATGKYVYFVDGDDTIQPHLIETVVGFMEDEADMVAFHFTQIFQDGTQKPGQLHEIDTFVLLDEKMRHDFIFEKLLLGKIGWEAWSRIYRRDKIEKYNLRFADNRKIFAEDLYFCLCYCAHAEKIVSIPDILYNYMIRSDSIMHTQKENLNIGRMNELCKELYEFWSQWEDCNLLKKDFSAIHCLVINNVMYKALKSIKNDNPHQIRTNILEDISDMYFFNQHVKGYFKKIKQLEKCYNGFFLSEMLSFYRFLLNGSRLGLSLRNHILYRINTSIDYFFGCTKVRLRAIKNALSHKKTVVVIGTEDFGNIGDHQIAVSMLNFIKQNLNTTNILEITASQYHKEKNFLFKHIRPHHIIVMPGGGNFGNIYPFAQNIREDVILNCPKNKKIIFPQTIHFSDDSDKKDGLKKATSIFAKENNVYLFARDNVSFNFAKEHLSCACFFSPDIVLSEKYDTDTKRSDRILLCLRSDLEGCASEKYRTAVDNILTQSALNSVSFDTQRSYNISVKDRSRITKETLNLWASSKIVITDRLHGMIFAAVTGTPCIALNNYNHKVKGTYEYIKYLPYIRFAESPEEIQIAFSELIKMKNCKFDNTPLMPYFEKLADILKES